MQALFLLRAVAASLGIIALPVFALAQDGVPARLRGTIDTLNGSVLAMTTREGEKVEVTLGENFRVSYPTLLSLDDIGEDKFVGAAAVEENGRLVALEVLVFPEAARGSGEGHYPWDLAPGSSMTNATVEEAAPEGEGRMMQVTYPDGEKEIFVPADIPVWTLNPGDASLLVPGAYVFVGARRQPDDTLTAASVLVEKDGVKPPN